MDDLCTLGGVRVAPSGEQLQRFVKRCGTLDCHKIASALEGKLRDGAWQCRLVCVRAREPQAALGPRALMCLPRPRTAPLQRALCVVEALLQSDIAGIQQCLVYLVEAIQDAQEDTAQQSVKDKAAKVIALMSNDDAETADTAVAARPVSERAHDVAMIVDLHGETATPSMPSATGSLAADTQTSDAAATTRSMFAGMSLVSRVTPGADPAAAEPTITGRPASGNVAAGSAPHSHAVDAMRPEVRTSQTMPTMTSSGNELMDLFGGPPAAPAASVGAAKADSIVFDPLLAPSPSSMGATPSPARPSVSMPAGLVSAPINRPSPPTAGYGFAMGRGSTVATPSPAQLLSAPRPPVQRAGPIFTAGSSADAATAGSTGSSSFDFMSGAPADAFSFVADAMKANQPRS